MIFKTHFLKIVIILITSSHCFANEDIKREVLCVVKQLPVASKSLPNSGPLVDLVVRSLKKSDIEVEVLFTSWARVLHEAEHGRCMIAGMWPSDQRKTVFHFSSKPVIKQTLGIYTRNGMSIDDVKGGFLAVERSSYISSNLDLNNWKPIEVKTPHQGAKMLALSRVNALYAEIGNMNYQIASDEDLTGKIKLAEPEIETVFGYLTISKNKNNATALIEAFDKNRDEAMIVKFEYEKETKNSIRYKEVPDEGTAPIVGSLYVQKWFAGDSKTIEITIDKKD
ncbi:hypothetical protein GQR58_006837 [Nymphon striatum]|nr:hypothetical protein GQR58_006837 [Nymphon striatum]